MSAGHQSQRAWDFSTLLDAESAFTRSVNLGLPQVGILSTLLDSLFQLEYASGMLLTLKPWRGVRPALIAERSGGAVQYWPLMDGRSEIEQVHSGRLGRWCLPIPDGTGSQECISLCFSSNGKGAVALTGLGPTRAEPMLELKKVFSDAIENLLMRDGILGRRAAGQPLMDMAECTCANLDTAEGVLNRITACPEGSPERLAAQARLAISVRELCTYTHIDKGLAELSSSLLVLTRDFHRATIPQAALHALRTVFGRMRAIELSHDEVDDCLDFLEEAGLDVFEAFGEDDDDDDQS